MKKPDITPAPWQQNGRGEIFRWGNGPETDGYYPRIAKVSIWKDAKAMGTANAKAISAVPEMIEALIEAEDVLQSVRNGYTVDSETADETWKNIFLALQKAGVTINEKAE